MSIVPSVTFTGNVLAIALLAAPASLAKDLLHKSFSSNFWAGGTPTPQEKMAKSGMGIVSVLAIALQEV